MKRLFLLLTTLIIICTVLAAQTRSHPSTSFSKSPVQKNDNRRDDLRNPPVWSWAHSPLNVMMSYFDYMPGGYNTQPLQLIPDSQGGGYFMVFHGESTSSATRKIYYAKISATGTLAGTGLLTGNPSAEGYPSLDVDPVTGIPFYAWHSNVDSDIDGYSESLIVWDKLLGGTLGTFAPVAIVIDNPISLAAPYNTTDNAFIWPVVQIGTSPTAGMRRIYLMGRNNVTHNSSGNLSENVCIAYADFSTDLLNNGTALTWSYTRVPQLDAWNHDTTLRRRPSTSLCVGNDGKIYVAGYHTTKTDYGNIINEPELDVFVCDNYGAGTWQRYSAFSHIQCWNPPDDFGTGGPTFNVDEPEYLYWGIQDSGHLNSVMDQAGRLHMAGMWDVTTIFPNGVNEFSTFPYIDWNSVKEAVFDTNTHEFFLREIYPMVGTAADTLIWLPWDTNADYIVDAYDPLSGNLDSHFDWNYPYWDHTVHGEEMAYQYNNFRITEPNDLGWMACVWQNSLRAFKFNFDNQTQYQAYANVPEIFISVSNDYGLNWSDPIVINSVDITQFAGNTPMYVYPADKIKNLGVVNGHPTGRLGLMYYHDNTWGSYSVTPAVGPNDGGYVKYMAIDIDMNSLISSSISGQVRRADNQQPIEGAVITAGINSTASNAQGYYTLSILPGVYAVAVSAPGYLPYSIAGVTVANGQNTPLDVNLAPLSSVYGIILGTNPAIPVSGAAITLLGINNHNTVSDSLGHFNIPGVVQNQTYLYVITKDGYQPLDGIIYVLETDYDMGTIQLLEIEHGNDEAEVIYADGFSGIYPNPFRNAASFSFTLKQAGPVEFDVFNIRGQLVSRLRSTQNAKGLNTITWDGRDINGQKLASGVYICRMGTSKFISSRKVMILD
jgi:hypothetical protein